MRSAAFLCLILMAGCRPGPTGPGADAGSDAGAVDRDAGGDVDANPVPVDTRSVAWMEPGDLVSLADPTTVYVAVQHGIVDPMTMEPDYLADLSSKIELWSLPGRQRVPGHLEVEWAPADPTGTGWAPDEAMRFHMVTDAPLGSGWYALVATAAPTTVLLGGWPPDVPQTLGVYTFERFTTGSHPVLVDIEGCDKGGAPPSAGLMATFSQPVDASAIYQHLHIDQGGMATVPTVGSGPPSAWATGGTWTCAGCQVTGSWHIVLEPGITAEDGRAVTTYPGLSAFDVTVDGSTLHQDGVSCRVFYAESP